MDNEEAGSVWNGGDGRHEARLAVTLTSISSISAMQAYLDGGGDTTASQLAPGRDLRR